MRRNIFGVSRFILLFLLVGCITTVSLLPLSAQDKKNDKSAPSASSTSTSPSSPQTTPPAQPAQQAAPVYPSPSAVNPVTKAAVDAGVLVCASRINQVVTFLTTDTKSSAYLFTPQRQTDQSLFSVSLGLDGQNLPTAYASASFAPTTNGQAAAVYDTVQYVPQSCADVEKNIFKTLKRKGSLGKDIVILDAGPVTVFLMPAGSGCVVIKKEIAQ